MLDRGVELLVLVLLWFSAIDQGLRLEMGFGPWMFLFCCFTVFLSALRHLLSSSFGLGVARPGAASTPTGTAIFGDFWCSCLLGLIIDPPPPPLGGQRLPTLRASLLFWSFYLRDFLYFLTLLVSVCVVFS